jgi:hypothetical protein
MKPKYPMEAVCPVGIGRIDDRNDFSGVEKVCQPRVAVELLPRNAVAAEDDQVEIGRILAAGADGHRSRFLHDRIVCRPTRAADHQSSNARIRTDSLKRAQSGQEAGPPYTLLWLVQLVRLGIDSGGENPAQPAVLQQRRRATPIDHRPTPSCDRQRSSYSSWRRHHAPDSLRPFGARSSHWYMPHRPSRPRA